MRRALLFFVSFVLAIAGSAAATTVATTGDASITRDQGGTWSISAGGATLTLALTPARDFQVVSLQSPSKKTWTMGTAADTSVTIEGTRVALGSGTGGFVYHGVLFSTEGRTLRLDASFDAPAAGLRVTRHYKVTSGSPTFEAWNTYTPLGAKPANLSDLNGFELKVANGRLRWLNGLQGDSSDVENDTAFTLQQKQLAQGESFSLGAAGRSSEQTVPWFAIDGADDEFFAALMWSGSWTLDMGCSGDTLSMSLGLASMTTALTQEIDGPHALFGAVRGSLPQATAALRSYALGGIRDGQPLMPLVTYNTWFAYGTQIDDRDMREEMDRATALGAELFVIDAGWYARAGTNGHWDFDSGLGAWEPDPVRFPDGLAPLGDYAHSLGMKFGLWVEPERVSLALVGAASGIDESWLATTNGEYGSDHAALICFANAKTRQAIFDRLTALIDEVKPDYLKWDNNAWVNCDRDGHGHGTDDGNFAQVTGLYAILAQLRTRYPGMLIENVSGGGNRLDLGMLRYTDAAWMDDRTAPSVNVRHNVQGLSAVFPPAYLLSFVTEHDSEPLRNARDMSLYFRSRMEGALGLCFRADLLPQSDLDLMAAEIQVYKKMRATLSVAAGALLTNQAAVTDGPDWDVLQEATADGGQLLLCAFQSNSEVEKITVKPTGLAPGTSYDVWSADLGLLGAATGSALMTDGIELLASPTTAGHILFVLAKQ